MKVLKDIHQRFFEMDFLTDEEDLENQDVYELEDLDDWYGFLEKTKAGDEGFPEQNLRELVQIIRQDLDRALNEVKQLTEANEKMQTELNAQKTELNILVAGTVSQRIENRAKRSPPGLKFVIDAGSQYTKIRPAIKKRKKVVSDEDDEWSG